MTGSIVPTKDHATKFSCAMAFKVRNNLERHKRIAAGIPRPMDKSTAHLKIGDWVIQVFDESGHRIGYYKDGVN